MSSDELGVNVKAGQIITMDEGDLMFQSGFVASENSFWNLLPDYIGENNLTDCGSGALTSMTVELFQTLDKALLIVQKPGMARHSHCSAQMNCFKQAVVFVLFVDVILLMRRGQNRMPLDNAIWHHLQIDFKKRKTFDRMELQIDRFTRT